MGAFNWTAEQPAKAFVSFITSNKKHQITELDRFQPPLPETTTAASSVRLVSCRNFHTPFPTKKTKQKKGREERSWDWRLVRAAINESATSQSSQSMREVKRKAATRIILISRTVVFQLQPSSHLLWAACGNWLCRLPRMPESLDFYFLFISLQGVFGTCRVTRRVAARFSPWQDGRTLKCVTYTGVSMCSGSNSPSCTMCSPSEWRVRILRRKCNWICCLFN